MEFPYFKSIKTYTYIILFSFLQIQCSKDTETDIISEFNELEINGLTEAEELLILVNTSRAEEGLDPLTLNEKLTKAALTHSKDMETNDFFSHTNLDGVTPLDRTKAAEYEGRYRAENIAWNQKNPEKVHEAWMNSDGHRKAILSVNSNEMGLGHSGPYWTQLFGYSE